MLFVLLCEEKEISAWTLVIANEFIHNSAVVVESGRAASVQIVGVFTVVGLKDFIV